MNRLLDYLELKYLKELIVYDVDNLFSYDFVRECIKETGFEIIEYETPENFRFIYENKLRVNNDKKVLILLNKVNIFISYDIKKRYVYKELKLSKLIPNLYMNIVKDKDLDLEFILNCENFLEVFNNYSIDEYVKLIYSKKNICQFIKNKELKIKQLMNENLNVDNWIKIAKIRAHILSLALKYSIEFDFSYIDEEFKKWILEGKYKNLSSIIRNDNLPAILPQIMSFKQSDRFALIVMDGMSIFDFYNMQSHLKDFNYKFDGCFALIPTTTSISRQSLMGAKYPSEMDKPFSVVNEKKLFLEAGIKLGYKKNNIKYLRENELDSIKPSDKLIAIILNYVDDIVHKSTYGKKQMLNDVKCLSNIKKLKNLICELLRYGFLVVMTSDHGNTECIGMGQLKGLGVTVETRSNRMIVLDREMEITDNISDNCYKYPGYYLSDKYNYYVCKEGKSFDVKGRKVNTHGSISIDEVVVPYVIFKEDKDG